MQTKFKIAIQVPESDKANRYFSFRLENDLQDEPAKYRQPAKVFVVSDIEGNFKPLCKLLIANKVINKRLQWTFGDNHLVVLGDCFDRGEQVTECLWLIYSLERKARMEAGNVHFILGNHEIMNLNGDWRYVHPKYAHPYKEGMQYTALYGGNDQLWRWLCTKNIMEKIGKVLYVHAGISKELLQSGLSITEINRKVRPYYTRANEEFADPLLSVVYNSSLSPFWYRGYYLGTATDELIDATLEHFGVHTIITGHTVVSQVHGFFDNKVINVNTDHAAGQSEGLMINRHQFFRANSNGKKERIK